MKENKDREMESRKGLNSLCVKNWGCCFDITGDFMIGVFPNVRDRERGEDFLSTHSKITAFPLINVLDRVEDLFLILELKNLLMLACGTMVRNFSLVCKAAVLRCFPSYDERGKCVFICSAHSASFIPVGNFFEYYRVLSITSSLFLEID